MRGTDAVERFAGTDRFRIERKVGAGAMGVVYEAVDRETGARIALKTLHRVRPDSLLRLKNEFRALQSIRHPNLVSLGELIESDGQWFFTMELITGGEFLAYVRATDVAMGAADTLDADGDGPEVIARAANGSTCDIARLRDAMRQLVGAVAALHAHGCIHRDIKPSNILVDESGRLVLCDFGLVANRDSGEAHHEDDEIVGTAPYMAPEQARSRPVGPAADWYGVGAVLYEALTGTPPFTGRPLDILVRKQEARPTPAHVIADVPRQLSDLAHDLLAIDPQSRPGKTEILERLGMVPNRSAQVRAIGSEPVREFVGRESELHALDASLPARDALGPTVANVHGVAGVGKTALVTAFLRRLRERGWVVLSGRCLEAESVPFKAFDGLIDQLAGYLRRMEPSVRDAALPDQADLLRRTFPVLGQVIQIGSRPGRQRAATEDAHSLRGATFTALRELLANLASNNNVVLAIDDFHWADGDSIELLRAILRPPRAPRIGVVLVSRTPLDRSLTNGLRLPFHSVSADALPTTDAAQLASELLRRYAGEGAHVDPAALAAEARGLPLYVAELARYVALAGAPDGHIPSLENALSERIRQLEASGIETLELASLAHAPITIGVLRDASGLSANDFIAAIGKLRAAHLLRSGGLRQDDTVEPYHDHVRQTVRRSMDASHTRDKHLVLASALAASPHAASRAELLSSHLEAGGELTQAALYAEEAAIGALRVFAFARAADQFARALRLGTHGRDKERDLLFRLADALANAGRGPESAETFEQLATGAKSAERLRCRMLAAEQYLVFGHLERGQAALERVLEEVGASLSATPRRALLGLLWGRLQVRLRGLGWRERSAADIPARDLSRIDAFAAVAVGLGLVDTVRSAEFQTRGLLLALRTGEPERVGRAMFYEAIAASMRGTKGFARGRTLWRRASELAERIEDPYLQALGTATGGMLSYFEGDFENAVTALQAGERGLRGQGRRAWGEINVDRTFQIFSLRMMGRVDELARMSSQYVWDAERRGDRYSATTFRRTSYLGLLGEADDDSAAAELARSSWKTPPGRWHLQDYFELHALNELALYRGDASELLDDFESSYEDFERSLIPRAVQITRCEALFLWGRLALASSDRPRGIARARHLAKRLHKERASFATVWALLIESAIQVATGEPESARTILASCIDASSEAKMELCEMTARWLAMRGADDEDSRRHRRRIENWCEKRGVHDPERLFEMMAPT